MERDLGYVYRRPVLRPCVAPLKHMKKIGPNMWIWDRVKIQGKYYLTRLVIRAKGSYYSAEIPTNKKGQLHDVTMAMRLLDIEDGDRQGRERNPLVDFSTNAEIRAKEKDLHKVYRWYLHPNESDITDIDTIKNRFWDILSKKESLKGPRGIVITGGTESQRQELLDTIKSNFTITEKRALAGNIMEIVRLSGSTAGRYMIATKDGEKWGPGIIQIDPKFITPREGNCEVFIHEAVHCLRQKDSTRPAELQAVGYSTGQDIDLEESLTEAETVARQRPFEKHESGTGYYQFLPKAKGNKEVRREYIKEDRITITDPAKGKDWKSVPKKGKRALNKVKKNYPKTHIGKLKIKGRAEAVEHFHRVIREKAGAGEPGAVRIHTFSPNPTPKTTRNVRKDVSRIPGRVVEFQDGKKKEIRRKGPNSMLKIRRNNGSIVKRGKPGGRARKSNKVLGMKVIGRGRNG